MSPPSISMHARNIFLLTLTVRLAVDASPAAASIDLSLGGWVRLESPPAPGYDAHSCWLMKARYNCQDDPRGEQAHMYRYVQRLTDGLASAPGGPRGARLTLDAAIALAAPLAPRGARRARRARPQLKIVFFAITKHKNKSRQVLRVC